VGSNALDPLELLGDVEGGAEEDMEAAVGQRISMSKWWVDGPKSVAQRAQHATHHLYGGQVEAEEMVLYRTMVEEITVREKRRTAESGETVDPEHVALRKKVSSVMYKSIFTQVVSTFTENVASASWRWLQSETVGSSSEGQSLAPRTRVSRLEVSGVSREMRTFYSQKVDDMFNTKFFERGVELSSLMLGLTDLAQVPPVEMKLWVDLFEAKWQEHKVIQSATFKYCAGLIKHQGAQTQDMLAEHQEPVWQREVGSARDPFTTTWLPKLGILEMLGGRQNGIVVSRETGAQTDESRLYHYSRGHGQGGVCRNCLAWARLVLAASLPDVRAVGLAMRRRHRRRAANLERSLEAHRVQQQRELEAQHRVEGQIAALGGQGRRSIVARASSRHLGRQGSMVAGVHEPGAAERRFSMEGPRSSLSGQTSVQPQVQREHSSQRRASSPQWLAMEARPSQPSERAARRASTPPLFLQQSNEQPQLTRQPSAVQPGSQPGTQLHTQSSAQPQPIQEMSSAERSSVSSDLPQTESSQVFAPVQRGLFED